MSVRRGEYANALSSMHERGDSVRPDYLVMAGRLEEALGTIRGRGDRLFETFLHYRLEDWDGVVASSGLRAGNEWLDLFRVHMRARAFSEKCMPDSVLSITSHVPVLSQDAGGAMRSHHLFGEVLEMRISTLIESGRTSAPEVLGALEEGDLGAASLLRLSSRLVEEDEYGRAAAILSGISVSRLDEKDIGDLESVLQKLSSSDTEYGAELPGRLALVAAAAGSYGQAEGFIDRIPETGSTRWEKETLSAMLMEKRDRLRSARRKYREIFRSTAPIHHKKNALLRIASIDYTLKRFSSSAENLRLFGRYYPADGRAESALDRSARIYVARKEWKEAETSWTILAGMSPETREGRSGVISLAAMKVFLGEHDGAREVLERFIGERPDDIEPAALYWMHRASGETGPSSPWLNRLKEEYPVSVYSSAATRESEWLVAGYPLHVLDVSVMEESERWSAEPPQDITGVAGTATSEPMFEALVYLAERGLLAEASAFSSVLLRRHSGDDDLLWRVYGLLRSRGLIRPGLSVVDVLFRRNGPGLVPASLLYPVPYAGLVNLASEREEVPAALLLSIIREESRFDPRAVSRAGALGLMQIMPSTGTWIGEKLKAGEIDREKIFSPEFNIEAGAWYLRFLLERSGDSIVGALASYNAGNSRMSDWRKTFEPWKDPLLAMEMIGLRETREYVRRVLDTFAAYTGFYSQQGDLR